MRLYVVIKIHHKIFTIINTINTILLFAGPRRVIRVQPFNSVGGLELHQIHQGMGPNQ